MKELKEKIIGKGGDDMVIENLSRIWDMHYERGVIEGKKEGKRAVRGRGDDPSVLP